MSQSKNWKLGIVGIIVLTFVLGRDTGSTFAFSPDGSGTMTVNPTTVVVGSVVELVFTYTAAESMNGGKIQLTVPDNWTSPRSTPGHGFTTAETDAGASVGIPTFSGQRIIVPIISLTVGQTVRIKAG